MRARRPGCRWTLGLAPDCLTPRSRSWNFYWYRLDTIRLMAMTLRLTEDEQDALRRRAVLDGTSMQEAARRAVREYVSKAEHRDRVTSAAGLIMERHGDALRRLGE